jgi:stage II sporulation SpoAA-like protein
VEHVRHWERIALVTDIDWIGSAMKVFSFLMPGDVRLFPLSAADQAREWIATPDMPAN